MEVSKKVSGILLDDRDLDGVVGGIDVSTVELRDKLKNRLRQEETGTGAVITGEMSPPFDW